jgi:hypothetical protein
MNASPRRACVSALVLAALLAGGCAGLDPYAQPPMREHLARDDDTGRCARLLQAVDHAVDAAGVRDAGTPRVPGFPYLRVDRFTASLAGPAAAIGDTGMDAWRATMAALDRRARAAELANAGTAWAGVAADARAARAGAPGAVSPAVAVEACRDRLAQADDAAAAALRAAARVDDDYVDALRVAGLYPLTRLPFAAGIRAWQHETRAVFATPLAALPTAGTLQSYHPALWPLPPLPVAPPEAAVLGVPMPPPARLAQWVARHAPALVVDSVDDDDRIGALRWSAGTPPAIEVDTAQPAAYVRVAYTRFGGPVRLQLVYTFWFPSRPAAHALDLLAGRLDGLLWRVTLDDDGRPLVYDSIHPCGCYHLFFPTDAVVARPPPRTLDEGLFAPQAAPRPAPDERIVLRVAARTHYLQRVGTQAAHRAAAGRAYTLRDADALRRLPHPDGGTRSAYDADGFVPGTQRAERWLFWPMGIASAGQMRQWGRHATAFVGRRHFDDADLLDRIFTLRDAAAAAAPAPPD